MCNWQGRGLLPLSPVPACDIRIPLVLMRRSCRRTRLEEWRKASWGKILGVSKNHGSMACHLGSRLPGDLEGADRKKARGRAMGKTSAVETWAFQARTTGLSQHGKQENVPQSRPQTKGFWLLAARHLARHEGKGTLQKISSRRKWFAFPA